MTTSGFDSDRPESVSPGYRDLTDDFGPFRSRRFDTPAARRFRVIAPALVSALIQLGVVAAQLGRFGHRVDGAQDVGGVVVVFTLAAVGPALLVAARKFPGPVALAVVLVSVLALFLALPAEIPPVAALIATVYALMVGARVWAVIAVGSALIGILSAALTARIDWSTPRLIIVVLAILVVFRLGESARSRRERFERRRVILAQRRKDAWQQERVELARELHDVLAHSLSQINVQAGVGLHLGATQPDRALEALANVKETSKQALDEVRAVLGIVRSGEQFEPSAEAPRAPTPDLAAIPALLAGVGRGGLEVETDIDVARIPSAAVQAAVYRIVQESLTNITRHSTATTAWIRVSDASGELDVSITDNGRPTSGGERRDAQLVEGKGLLGMRERTQLLGGSFSAGRTPSDGGFVVSARLPLASTQTEETP